MQDGLFQTVASYILSCPYSEETVTVTGTIIYDTKEKKTKENKRVNTRKALAAIHDRFMPLYSSQELYPRQDPRHRP
jgi:hypothetical protein